MRKRLSILACVAVSSLTLMAGQQAQVAGNASISGLVVDAQNNVPVRFAGVGANNSGRSFDINTDEAGRFRLARLPAGSYLVSAAAPGYLATRYGADGPRKPGIPLALADHQRISDVVIKLVRGAAVSGRITTPDGQPVVNVEVRLLEWVHDGQTGERAVVARLGGQRATNVEGFYRLFDVPPGTYLVATTAAPPWNGSGLRSGNSGPESNVEIVAHADVVAALAGGAPPAPRVAPRVRPVPTFYPGALRAEIAQPIAVAAGDEVTNVDFHVQMLPTGTIRGRLVTRDGTAPQGAMVYASQPASVGSRGSTPDFAFVREDTTFQLTDLAPGDYVVSARARSGGSQLWAIADVTLAGRDVSDLTLMLEPDVSVSGRVRREGATLTPAVLSTLRIGVAPVGAKHAVGIPSAVPINPDGRFRIVGLVPGRYMMTISRDWRDAAMSSAPQPWLKTAIISNSNAADVPVEISADVPDAVVTVSDRTTTLTGTVVTATGARAHGSWVVLFSADRNDWQPRSRRVRASQVIDGAFTFAALPPGTYLVATVPDVEYGQWFDRDFLERLAPAAARVVLMEGAAAKLDLRAAHDVRNE